jgi:hypothetical protein
MHLTGWIRQLTIEFRSPVVRAVDAMLAMFVQGVKIDLPQHNALCFIQLINDIAVIVYRKAVTVVARRSVIYDQDVRFVLESPGAEQTAMDIACWAAAGQWIEDQVRALEHQ